MSDAEETERAYLTLASLPDELEKRESALLLSEVLGVDVYTINQKLKHDPPLILKQMSVTEATDMAAALQAAGVSATAISEHDLALVGTPMRVKYLTKIPEGFIVETWEGISTTLPCEQLRLVIAAPVISEEKRQPAARVRRKHRSIPILPGAGAGMVAASIHNIKNAAQANADLKKAVRNANIIIDLHTENDLWFRIDGRKFGYQVLGEKRALSDYQNSRILLDMIRECAPEATIDENFHLFRPPPGLKAETTDIFAYGQNHARALADFNFYSRWLSIIKRA